MHDEKLHSVLVLLEDKGFNDLSNLYKVLEIIESDMPGNNQSERQKEIETNGLSTKDDIEKFRISSNHNEIVGLKNARHGYMRTCSKNKKAVSYSECVSIMRNLILNWFEYKISSVETTCP